MKLAKERDSLALTAKKLDRDLAKVIWPIWNFLVDVEFLLLEKRSLLLSK